MNVGDATPLASVGITCYNAADTIARAIKGALDQTWPRLEVIIVDDRSTDNSVDIVRQAIARIPNARVVQHEVNAGPAAARNTILREARGEFIAFFDDDDVSLPDRVTRQIRHLEDYERRMGVQRVACFASGIRKYPSGYTMPLPAIGSRGDAPNGPEFADFLLYYRRRPDWDYGVATPACSMLARKSTFDAVGGFDSTLRRVEDNDFAIRLALAQGHFTGVAEALFVQYSTSAPDKSPERNLEAEQAIVRKYRLYLEAQGRYYYALNWHRLRYWHFKRRYGALAWEFFKIWMRYPISATKHFVTTGSRRIVHERRMKSGGSFI